MQIFAPKEVLPHETRAPLVPECVEKLLNLGAAVTVESGIGRHLHVDDDLYQQAGAAVSSDRAGALGSADIILRVCPPPLEEISLMKRGGIHISFMDPFRSPELVHAFASSEITAFSMELMPRSTIAQKMDALSSQASLAGYVAVIAASGKLHKILPMMMTPSGTIHPARVFVIGAGVAGLQAIATAKRLGARVEAFDTRPEVAEQVQSLGARFVKIDLGETAAAANGYAKALTEAQLQKQREEMAKICARSDIVITTAQLFGRKAPLIVTDEMLKGMRRGSVVVDLAVESGGNVEGAQAGMEVCRHGVTILGYRNLPGQVSFNASEMYANNLTNFIEHFWNKEAKSFLLDEQNEIIKSTMVTHRGALVHPLVKDLYLSLKG